MKVSDAMKVAQARNAATSGATATESPEKAERTQAERPSGARSGDRVSVVQSSVVDEAARIARNNRAARLKEVEAAVHQGAYRPDPAQIAERILEDAETAARLRASLLGG